MRHHPLILLTALLIAGPLRGQTRPAVHPLDPLSKDEITAAVQILRAEGKATDSTRFTTIALQEPPKEEVWGFTPGRPFRREAFVVAYQYSGDRTFEGVVDLLGRRVLAWKQVPGVEAPFMDQDDGAHVTEIVRADPGWGKAIAAHGADRDTVRIVPNLMPFAPPQAGRGRLVAAETRYVRAYVNVTEHRVLEVEERSDASPDRNRRFDAKRLPQSRFTNAPLHIVQPDGGVRAAGKRGPMAGVAVSFLVSSASGPGLAYHQRGWPLGPLSCLALRTVRSLR